MKKKTVYIKVLLCIISICSIFLMTKMNVLATESDNIRYITTSVGSSYDNVGISYHADNNKTALIYGTDSTLQKSTKVLPISKLWENVGIESDTKTGFEPRYVCNVRIEGLKPETKYYYKIVGENESSKIYSFTTCNNNTQDQTSFLYITDTQNSSLNGYAQTNELLTSLENKVGTFDMVFFTGDIINYGGYEEQWQMYFEAMPVLEKYMYASVPGNHEYYHTTDGVYRSPEYYNQFFYNPQNGPTQRMNSSYYFEYDDVLFIMLDVINKEYQAEHQTWFKDVVAKNKNRWIIVGMHGGVLSTWAHQASTEEMIEKWQPVFEETQVDLVIFGHDHAYARQDLQYQGEKNEELGITYLMGGAAGPKTYSVGEPTHLDEYFVGNFMSQVIEINDDTLKATLYDKDINVLTSFSIKAKRENQVIETPPVVNDEPSKCSKANMYVIVSSAFVILGYCIIRKRNNNAF